MALQLGALRDALLAADVPPDKANAAAEERANYETRLASLETRMAALIVMVSGLYAVLTPLFWLVFRIAGKVGAV